MALRKSICFDNIFNHRAATIQVKIGFDSKYKKSLA